MFSLYLVRNLTVRLVCDLCRQANFCECVPFALLLVTLIENTGRIHDNLLAAICGILILGRISHGYAFSFIHVPDTTHFTFRKPGMAMTLCSVFGLSVLALYSGLMPLPPPSAI